MKTEIYIQKPSEEDRQLLRNYGYEFCDCCDFENVRYFHILPNDDTFHGVGFKCENDCKDKDCVLCAMKDSLHYGNLFIFHNAQEFLDFKNNEQGRID